MAVRRRVADRIAEQHASRRNGAAQAHNGRPRPKATSSSADGFNLTDLGNAQRLVHRHGSDLRYCHPWRKWLVWDGSRWSMDQTGEVERRARQTVLSWYRQVADMTESQRAGLVQHAQETERRAERLRAMVDLARSEPGIPILPESMDTHPWLLNCQNGTLNLRNGELREHQRDDLITKKCPVAFEPAAACPAWKQFLTRIFAGDGELVGFVQRLLGLCLTGQTTEHILPIFHGVGANGKSTLLNALLNMLGTDYAIKAAPELLLAKQSGGHPTELTDLFGKRLAVCIETDDGKRFAEARLKELTGGDKVRARRMREDFWEFDPTHKLILCTNHKPETRGNDHALWRRLRLIPFSVTIPDDQQDKQLGEKLRAELPGILNWCLAGCRAWQRDGLGLPECVRAATADYRQEQDTVSSFLNERCLTGPDYRARASDLYSAFKNWCKSSGEADMTQRKFGMALRERGYASYSNNGTWYTGLAPRTEPTEGTEPFPS